MLLMMLCTTVSAKEMSPQWIKNLEAAKNATQMVIVAGIGKTTAWVSMHENVVSDRLSHIPMAVYQCQKIKCCL